MLYVFRHLTIFKKYIQILALKIKLKTYSFEFLKFNFSANIRQSAYREYLFESTRIDSSRCRPDFTRYIHDGSPARKKYMGDDIPFKHWSYYRYLPAWYRTHFKLPFWIKWSTWFNKIWKWNNHLSFKRMIL